MTTQTNYLERQAKAVAGMVASMRAWDAITRTCETAAGIGFGLAVGRGSADHGAILGGALGLFRGATIKDVTLMGSQSDKYVQYQNMSILTEGEIWVQVTGTPGPGDPVHYSATTGIFASSGGSGPVLGARWMELSDAGLGRLYLSGNGQVAA
jgi:hypothetical protein